jgi:hypothetical protein
MGAGPGQLAMALKLWIDLTPFATRNQGDLNRNPQRGV